MAEYVKYLSAGDSGLVVEFGDVIDEKVNARVHLLAKAFEKDIVLKGIKELIPTYRSLMIVFDPFLISRKELTQLATKYIDDNKTIFDNPKSSGPAKVVEIPVWYGGDFGPDIKTVAEHNNISEEEVINIHTSGEYKVYMLGFMPGFCYLGGLDKRIECPRLKTPRTKIPAGSVGIAGSQTGVYPVDSPGGWQLLGKTPFRMFDIKKENPFLVNPGDVIKFKAISEEEFQKIEERLAVEND